MCVCMATLTSAAANLNEHVKAALEAEAAREVREGGRE